MGTPTPTRTADDVAEQLHDEIAAVTNELLDAYYEAKPYSNAFGEEYEGVGTNPDGTVFIGREDGADGADDPLGFDYFSIKHPDTDPDSRQTDETHYVYGKYGWMDLNDLVEWESALNDVFEAAAADGYLSDAAAERVDAAFEATRETLRDVREQYDLSDVAAFIHDHEIDTLRDLLGHGEEENRVLWQLLFSKDEEGDTFENPIEVPVISERDQMMLVRTERYYYDEYDDEGEHYAYAAVIGYDDTPERFFVHRLSSDPDVRDDDTEWTAELVREKMGFDANLSEVNTSEDDRLDLPYGQRVRVQGDLTIVRHDVEAARAERVESIEQSTRRSLFRDHSDAFAEAHPEWDDHEEVSAGSYRVRVYSEVTDELKEIQGTLGISEEAVRDEQDARGYGRLSAKRRREIVTDLAMEKAAGWAVGQSDQTAASIREEAVEQAEEEYAPDGQQNEVIGNHTVILGGASEAPERTKWLDGNNRAAFVVEDEGMMFVIHDEHGDKQVMLGPGVYTFAFLDGYEDEWWMN
ncbi:hypothetical protein [Halorubrum sp. Atlit-26R]|uniref:hypothetical protein n=1 Tax=Halorubrum sp. Atlit-26R TaxID=2282128 RepID=UPI000EF17613|nr:hypothetical protein [Halorubrum sp. Atlit-26R]RLM68558.1 hypothetical protein DVK07_10580 [Halorubrum sp. Atlit-26R]